MQKSRQSLESLEDWASAQVLSYLEYEMAGFERVTVVAEAVRRELDRRRHDELRRSLQNPHSETTEFAKEGLEEWSRGLPEEDVGTLVDSGAGKAVRWVPGEGWVEEGA